MLRYIAIPLFSLTILSCSKDAPQEQGEIHYILIGTESTPPYSDLQIGGVFGENVSVSVGSPHPFGTIEITWDGAKEATFDTGKDFRDYPLRIR